MRQQDKTASLQIARSLALAMLGTKRQLDTATKLTPAQQRRADDLRRLMEIMGRTTAALALAVVATGCTARGYEIGGRLGFYEVDERQESSQMHRAPHRSALCKLTGQGCPPEDTRAVIQAK